MHNLSFNSLIQLEELSSQSIQQIQVYQPDKIIDEKINRDGKLIYKVTWKNAKLNQAKWQTAKLCQLLYPKLVLKFKNKFNQIDQQQFLNLQDKLLQNQNNTGNLFQKSQKICETSKINVKIQNIKKSDYNMQENNQSKQFNQQEQSFKKIGSKNKSKNEFVQQNNSLSSIDELNDNFQMTANQLIANDNINQDKVTKNKNEKTNNFRLDQISLLEQKQSQKINLALQLKQKQNLPQEKQKDNLKITQLQKNKQINFNDKNCQNQIVNDQFQALFSSKSKNLNRKQNLYEIQKQNEQQEKKKNLNQEILRQLNENTKQRILSQDENFQEQKPLQQPQQQRNYDMLQLCQSIGYYQQQYNDYQNKEQKTQKITNENNIQEKIRKQQNQVFLVNGQKLFIENGNKNIQNLIEQRKQYQVPQQNQALVEKHSEKDHNQQIIEEKINENMKKNIITLQQKEVQQSFQGEKYKQLQERTISHKKAVIQNNIYANVKNQQPLSLFDMGYTNMAKKKKPFPKQIVQISDDSQSEKQVKIKENSEQKIFSNPQRLNSVLTSLKQQIAIQNAKKNNLNNIQKSNPKMSSSSSSSRKNNNFYSKLCPQTNINYQKNNKDQNYLYKIEKLKQAFGSSIALKAVKDKEVKKDFKPSSQKQYSNKIEKKSISSDQQSSLDQKKKFYYVENGKMIECVDIDNQQQVKQSFNKKEKKNFKIEQKQRAKQKEKQIAQKSENLNLKCQRLSSFMKKQTFSSAIPQQRKSQQKTQIFERNKCSNTKEKDNFQHKSQPIQRNKTKQFISNSSQQEKIKEWEKKSLVQTQFYKRTDPVKTEKQRLALQQLKQAKKKVAQKRKLNMQKIHRQVQKDHIFSYTYKNRNEDSY